jgi:hypothetical protein
MITRLPLAVPTEPRTASLDKDALLQNCFIDQDANTGTLYAVKRPGKILESEPSNVTTNRGIFFSPGLSKLYYINDFDNPVEIVL